MIRKICLLCSVSTLMYVISFSFPFLIDSQLAVNHAIAVSNSAASLDNWYIKSSLGWQVVMTPLQSLRAIDMIDLNDGWAVGADGLIMHWNGTVWSTVSSPVTANLLGISMLSATDGWIVGTGVILRWNGSVWTQASNPAANTLRAIKMISANEGWAVGDAGTIIRWNGSSWANAASPITDTAISLRGIDMVSTSDGWAAGGALNSFPGTQVILRWNGSAWGTISQTTDYRLLAISTQASNTAFAAGSGGAAIRWNGTTWDKTTFPRRNQVNGIKSLSANDVWAVDAQGYVFHWAGNAWTEDSQPTTQSLNAIDMVSTDDGWAVGDNAILHYQKQHSMQAIKLNGALVKGGSVFTAWPSRDSEYMVYLADQDIDEVPELYSVSMKTKALRKLHPDLALDSFVNANGGTWPTITNNRAVFTIGLLTNNSYRYQIYSSPLGDGEPILLAEGPVNNPLNFTVTPDGQTVIYILHSGLFSIPIEGGDVTTLSTATMIRDVQIYSSTIMYLSSPNLYRVPLQGGNNEQLNQSLDAESSVTQYRVSGDGKYVVYSVDSDDGSPITYGTRQMLYSRSLSGNTINTLSSNVTISESVSSGSLIISPDNTQVAYSVRSGVSTDSGFNSSAAIYRVPISDGTPSLISQPLASNEIIPYYASVFSPDSQHFAYWTVDTNTYNPKDIYLNSLASNKITKLAQSVNIWHIQQFQFISNDQVIYVADKDSDDQEELYVGTLDGAAQRLDENTQRAYLRYVVNGSEVFYTAQHTDTNSVQVYSIPLTGGSPSQLNDPLVDNGSVNSFQTFGGKCGSCVWYIADQDTDEVRELYLLQLQKIASISSSTGAPGSQFVFEGNDFPANTEMPVYLTPPAGNVRGVLAIQLGTVTSDNNGRILLTLASNACTTPGQYTLAIGDAGSTLTTFMVEPSNQLQSPTTQGATFEIPGECSAVYLPVVLH